MQKLILFGIIIILNTTMAFSQSWNKKMGDRYFDSFSYYEAIKKYKYIDNKTIEINRKLAESYFKTGNYTKAEEYYNTVAIDSLSQADDYYKYAYILSINKKYEDAETWMSKYYKLVKDDSRAKAVAENKGFYKRLMAEKQSLKVENVNINTKNSDFGLTFYKNKVVFTSTNTKFGILKKQWAQNKLPYLDMYEANFTDDNKIDSISKFFTSYKTKYHKGPATFNEAGNFMIFTVNGKEKTGKNKLVRLQLFSSHKSKKGEWSKPKKLNFNSIEYSVGQASLTPDGKTLYFVSDMPGGFGQTDIYVSHLKGSSSWSKPQNLGKEINTEGKEMFPFIHADGLFFYSSDGKLGLGGLDIFTTTISNGEILTKPENMGTPINSNNDDFSFVLNRTQTKGFFASNREGGKGDDDLYYFILEKPMTNKLIAGVAKDEKGNILAGVDVILFEGNKIIKKIATSDNGSYQFSVFPGKEYILTGKKFKHEDAKNNISTKNSENKIISDLILTEIPDITLLCKVTDKNNNPLDSVNFVIINNYTKERKEFLTDSIAEYRKILENELNDTISYNIKLEKEGYLTKEINYVKVLTERKEYFVDLKIFKLEVGTNVAEMENVIIYFDLDKYNLRDEAKIELDKIVTLMNNNPDIKIELSAHTDCRGSGVHNMHLSQNRAKSSADYIKSRITNPERIYGKGYGSTMPVNDCNCKDKDCTEEEYQQNRRTEFRLVK